MENLYESLYDDVISDNFTETDNIGTKIIRAVNGHVDLYSLSNYYSIEENNAHVNTTSQPSLNIFHLNVRSLQKNFHNLSSIVKCFSNPPHIIASSETWLKDSTSHMYVLEAYI